MVAERSLERGRAAGHPHDNPEITADRQYFSVYDSCSHGRRPAGTPEHSVVRLCSGRRLFRLTAGPIKTNPRASKGNTGPCQSTRGHEPRSITASRAQRMSSDQWKSLKTYWWDDTGWNSSSATANWWDDAKSLRKSWQETNHWTASHSHPTEPTSFPGFTAN